jgi:cytochrome c oxidase assembly protein subunit 15
MMFQTQNNDRRAVGYWLLFMTFMVFLMVMVGGATRLTESGLSMTDWRPVTGTLPPLSTEAWQAEFGKYQQSPEYRVRNAGMNLEEFKGIFYWEWGHRLLGRLLGVFFALPLAWFWIKGRIPAGYKPKLLVLLVLGGSQGLLGWYMVMSGLVDEPAVSHYRLTAHLMLALFIMAALWWNALSLLNPRPAQGTRPLKMLTHFAMMMLVLQLIMGALVAGLKAGHMFNTWPLMGESFVPEGLMIMEPALRNFIDNAITVQFDHRIGAYILTALVVTLFWRSRSAAPVLRRGAYVLLAFVIGQMTLGIVTLVMDVPVFWGTAHQGGGALVLLAMVYMMHLQRRKEAQ